MTLTQRFLNRERNDGNAGRKPSECGKFR